MKDGKGFNDYENDVLNIDEVDGTDVKINPDFYIHLGLVKLSNTFEGNLTVKESFQKYRHIVEHIEVLCDAANLLDNDYKEKIKKFIDTEEYKRDSEDYIRSATLARFKLKLMMGGVFKHKVATDPLKS